MADPIHLLRDARRSVDKHQRIIARSVNQAFKKGDAIAADRYVKQLDRLRALLASIDEVVTQ